MRNLFVVSCLLLNIYLMQAQISKDTIDQKYLEDQIYLSLTYNALVNKPTNVSQNGFSGGVGIGFIKDIPLNKRRNIGIGFGVGYSYNSYIQNLKITTKNNITSFVVAQNYKTNRFGISAIELPFEVRWRNSTPSKYKFWRVYGGLKMSYILSAKTRFEDSVETLKTKNIDEFNRFQYGLVLSAGFSTWNLYVYYGLNPIFKEVDFNESKLNLKDLNIGLKFYIM